MFIFKPRFVAVVFVLLAAGTAFFTYYYVENTTDALHHAHDGHDHHDDEHRHFYPNTDMDYEATPFGAAEG